MARLLTKDIRSLAQVAKAVATMRRKVAQAVRKHEKLQARIQALVDAGRIISLNRDCDILAGENCWYVKADSLNTNKDAEANWYYVILYIEEYGVYQCSCENVKQADCKHSIKLGASFAPVQDEMMSFQFGNTRIETVESNLRNALEHEVWSREMVALMHEEEKRNQAPLNGNQGFSKLRKAS